MVLGLWLWLRRRLDRLFPWLFVWSEALVSESLEAVTRHDFVGGKHWHMGKDIFIFEYV